MASVIFDSIVIFITKISIPKNIYAYYLLLKAKEKFTLAAKELPHGAVAFAEQIHILVAHWYQPP